MAYEIGKYVIVHTLILLSHLDDLFCHLDNTDNYRLTLLNITYKNYLKKKYDINIVFHTYTISYFVSIML